MINRRTVLSVMAASIPVLLPHKLSAVDDEIGRPIDLPGHREYWLMTLRKIIDPVLVAASRGRLMMDMPVEAVKDQAGKRQAVTHLEALGRTLAGVAPWLEHATVNNDEKAVQRHYVALAQQSIVHAVDPSDPGFLNFQKGGQPLVDAAFLAHALLRAPTRLWSDLPQQTRDQLVRALQSTRVIRPYRSNWLLFSAIVEAALMKFTGEGDIVRMDYAVTQHLAWYKGDGIYGDGEEFHWDYYNSFVIQPMLLEVVGILVQAKWEKPELLTKLTSRARRYCIVQERLIAPDGSFAAFGRSLAYRCGAFQHLAHMILRGQLPPELPLGAVRSALTAVIKRTLEPAGTFDERGWLRIGLCGHQPSLGEHYISTGSLYLCTSAFLPLGLPANDTFWTSKAADWTSRRIWSGQDVDADHAL